MSGNNLSEWDLIRKGCNEVERLIGQKEYNLAMIKARQTLETMVAGLSVQSGIEFTDLSGTIDQLYHNQVISRTAYDHYHKIRVIGNKAAHQGDNNAYNATTAYHLLSQEIYAFTDSYASERTKKKRPGIKHPVDEKYSSSRKSGFFSDLAANIKSLSWAELLFRIAIPVLIVIVLIVIIKLVSTPKVKPEPTATEVETVEVMTLAPTMPPTVATEPPTVPAVWKTTDTLRVRKEPNTDGEILGLLDPGTIINYIEDYDDKWASVYYNGDVAFVSKDYIAKE